MSSDRGLTWTIKESWMTEGGALALSPTDADVVFTTGTFDDQGTYKMAIDYSLDGGSTWNHVLIDEAYWGWGVAFDPFNSNRVYAGGGTAEGAPEFLVSDNLGQNWTKAQAGLPSTVGTICPDPAVPGLLYCATGDGVCRTDDYGQTWQTTALTAATWALLVDPDNQDIYAGTSTGIYLSSDGGYNWGPINEGLTTTDVRSLARSCGPVPRFYAGTAGGGVFRTPTGTGVVEARPRSPNRSMNISNPCRGFLFVRLSSPAPGPQPLAPILSVFDACGRFVLRAGLSGQQSQAVLDLRGLSAGTYLVRLTAPGWSATRSFVMTH